MRPPMNATSDFDNAIMATGAATVQWLRGQGSYAPNATSEVASHVAIAWRNTSAGGTFNGSSAHPQPDDGIEGGAGSGGLFFVQALPVAGVVLTPSATFWAQQPAGTVAYRAGPRPGDSALRAAAAKAAQAAKTVVGARYARDFEPPSSGAYYCSSLVEWSYEQAMLAIFEEGQRARGGAAATSDRDGGVLRPGNFTLLFVPLSYWQAYYAKLGLDLPVNVTGSNPTLLLHSPRLTFAPCNGNTC